MAAPALCQDPLLVMPAKLLHQSQALIRNANLPSCPVITATIDQERRDELRVLHRALQRDFPTMRRALAYYESLIRGDGTTQQVPELGFLRHAAAHNQVDFPRALADRQPGPKPHELQVVFHRARWLQHRGSKFCLHLLSSLHIVNQGCGIELNENKKHSMFISCFGFFSQWWLSLAGAMDTDTEKDSGPISQIKAYFQTVPWCFYISYGKLLSPSHTSFQTKENLRWLDAKTLGSMSMRSLKTEAKWKLFLGCFFSTCTYSFSL